MTGAGALQVRPAQEKDLPGLFELCAEAAGEKLPQEVFGAIFHAALADTGRRLMVAVKDGRPVGYGDLQRCLPLCVCAPVAVLSEFYVEPASRSQGVGTAMLIALLAQAKAMGCTRLSADCSRVNLKSQAFLDRHGFVRTLHHYTRSIR